MNAATQQHNWTHFLKFYNEQNKGRATRLGVFENENDYWLENGLPLVGIDVDMRGELPTVEIILENFTHTVKNARELNAHFTFEAGDEGLDIIDAEGKTSILRFAR